MPRAFVALTFFGCLIVVGPSNAQVDSGPTAARQESAESSATTNEQKCPLDSASQSQNRTSCPIVQEHGSASHTGEITGKYVPLSTRGKFNIFFRSTYDVSTFFSAAFEGTLAQAEGQWPGYGGGFPGWGKRIGASLADTEARKFIQSFALCSVLHQDPRYFHSRSHSHLVRAAYAVTRVVVTRSDNGKNVFNSSELLGTLFTSSLQNSYYPGRQRGLGITMERFLSSLSSDASSNLLKEFWPDIRRIFHKHAPGPIKKIEEHIPDSIEKEITP